MAASVAVMSMDIIVDTLLAGGARLDGRLGGIGAKVTQSLQGQR